MRGAEVDFVFRAVQAEPESSGRLTTVEVIDEQRLNLLSHEMILAAVAGCVPELALLNAPFVVAEVPLQLASSTGSPPTAIAKLMRRKSVTHRI